MASITLDQARSIITRTFAHGREMNLQPLSVCVLDVGGHLKAFEREDGASNMRFQIAHGKAFGAIGMGLGSRALMSRAEVQGYFILSANSALDGRLVPVPGGVLVRDRGGAIIGAVGVTGDTSDNDEAAAVSAIEAVATCPTRGERYMTDPITRLNAALEGRYRIEREIGEGGMATVYLAHDERHNRNVALKVLKAELAAVVGAERFLAEIETTAKLTHPHILPLHDSGEADAFLFFVTPFIEGESLRDRLDRDKQLPVDDAVRIAREIADALDYAHRQGVIHRDIKPGNILLHEGRVIVADFGIALAVGAAGGDRITETGLSVGTPHYMSPEQATGGQQLGPPTDTYALACVLYEMLVGEPPYSGPTPQAILGLIITGDPVSAVEKRSSMPPNVDAAIRKALEKLPADRFATAQEFAGALGDPRFRVGEETAAGVARGSDPWKGLALATSALALIFALGFGWALLRPAPPAPVTRSVLLPPSGVDVAAGPTGIQGFAVSPDGRTVVFPDGRTGQLYRHELDQLAAAPIPGGERAWYPFFSPDGEWVAYFNQADNTLRKIRLDGSQAQTLAPVPLTLRSAGWSTDGNIVLHSSGLNGLWRVRDTGGELEQIPNIQGPILQWLDLLPNGRSILATTEASEVVAVSLETGERRVLFAGTTPRYVATGHIVFWRADALWAVPFDPERLEALGPPAPIVERVSVDPNALAHFAVGGDLLSYREGSSSDASGMQQLVVIDLEGNSVPLALAARPIPPVGVGWSPDGQSVVYESVGQIYTYNVTLGTTPRQLTFQGINERPVFSPDGTRVAFSTGRVGTDAADLFVKDLNDDSPPRPITTLDGNQYMTQWPADTLILFESGQGGGSDLWMVNLSDPDDPGAEVYLSSEDDLTRLVVSPDGTLAAYQSDESGEIYIRSFPDPGERTVVSRGGAWTPFWSPDGNTLYYSTGNGQPFIAARLQRNPVPVVLSTDTLFAGVFVSELFPASALHPDGDRLIGTTFASSPVAEEDNAPQPERLILVQNFFEELRQVVPE